MNRKTILYILVAALTIITQARSLDIEPETLAEAISSAEIVATIKITGTRPATFKYDGDDYVCGVFYTAKISKLYKGQQRDFEFFSAVDSFFTGFSDTYLVIVDNYSARQVQHDNESSREILAGLKIARQACIANASKPLAVSSFVQKAFPIIEGRAADLIPLPFEGKAIKIVPGYPVFLGLNDITAPKIRIEPILSDFEVSRFPNQDYFLASYDDLELEIQRLLAEQ